MTRSLLAFLAVPALAAAILLSGGGCGGGGGTSGSNGGNPTVPGFGTAYGQQIVGVDASTGATRSLSSLAVGDVVTLRILTLYNTGRAQLLDASDIDLNAPSDVATLEGSTLRIVGTGSGSVSARNANGSQLVVSNGVGARNATLFASARAATVRGTVTSNTTTTNPDAGVSSVQIDFLNASNDVVSTTVSGVNGQFQANVPSSAVRFAVSIDQRNRVKATDGRADYYNNFSYQDLDYIASPGCGALLPTLSAGTTTTLSGIFIYRANSSTPPPPPTGCTQ